MMRAIWLNLAVRFERLLCRMGFHSPYYAYDMSTWRWTHLGWRCRHCERPLAYRLNIRAPYWRH